MATTFATYAGDGATNEWTVPFPYLSKDHVHVYVNDVEDLEFTWLTGSMVAASVTPAAGSTVLVKRNTPRNALTVVIPNAGTLRGKDINTQSLQALYISEEAYDALADVLRSNFSGTAWDAQNRNISNLSDPESDQDAATKKYVDGRFTADKAAVAASAATATSQAVIATSQATIATTQAGIATTKADLTAADALATAADRLAVAADKATVANDKGAVAADKAAVAADKATVAADKATVAADKTTATNAATAAQNSASAAAADRVQTGLDRTAVANDKATVAADKATVAADKTASGVNAANAASAASTATTQAGIATTKANAAAADALATAADRVQTGLDKAATAADRVQTWNDRGYAESYRLGAWQYAQEALGSATAASGHASSASSSFLSFDKRYLGAKSANPTTDNQGAALVAGSLFWNTTLSRMFVWSGSSWNDFVATFSSASTVPFTPTGSIAATNVQAALQELDTEKFPKTGGTFTGSVGVSNTAGQVRDFTFFTGANRRWLVRCNDVAEGGSNTGSDFQISGLKDDGTFMPASIYISRSNGAIQFGTIPKILGLGDTVISSGGQLLTGGYDVVPPDTTMSSGTLTPSCINGPNVRLVRNKGAHTLAPPPWGGTYVLQYYNDVGAGPVTFSGFTKITGDAYAPTLAKHYLFYITKAWTVSHLHIVEGS